MFSTFAIPALLVYELIYLDLCVFDHLELLSFGELSFLISMIDPVVTHHLVLEILILQIFLSV